MKYLIIKTETTKTSTGKDMWKATLKNTEGVDETINFFDKVIEGEYVEGEIYTNEKGYRNFKSTASVAKSNYANNQKVELEYVRNENIKQNMRDKEESIAWFNSRNTALVFVEKYVSDPKISSVSEALEMVNKYTEIFFKEWQKWSESAF